MTTRPAWPTWTEQDRGSFGRDIEWRYCRAKGGGVRSVSCVLDLISCGNPTGLYTYVTHAWVFWRFVDHPWLHFFLVGDQA